MMREYDTYTFVIHPPAFTLKFLYLLFCRLLCLVVRIESRLLRLWQLLRTQLSAKWILLYSLIGYCGGSSTAMGGFSRHGVAAHTDTWLGGAEEEEKVYTQRESYSTLEEV
jgi:hypothetical protein